MTRVWRNWRNLVHLGKRVAFFQINLLLGTVSLALMIVIMRCALQPQFAVYCIAQGVLLMPRYLWFVSYELSKGAVHEASALAEATSAFAAHTYDTQHPNTSAPFLLCFTSAAALWTLRRCKPTIAAALAPAGL